MNRQNSKAVILDAVEAVIAKAGAARMSLDSVAQKAGVSKGGLMYHFPTKKSLIKAVVDRLVEEFQTVVKERMKKSDSHSDFPEVVLDCVLSSDEYRLRIGKVMLTACLSDCELLKPFDNMRQDVEREMRNSGVAEEKVGLISYTIRGIILRELLQSAPLAAREKTLLKRELLLLVSDKNKNEINITRRRHGR